MVVTFECMHCFSKEPGKSQGTLKRKMYSFIFFTFLVFHHLRYKGSKKKIVGSHPGNIRAHAVTEPPSAANRSSCGFVISTGQNC